jgi:hypothetical protein
MGFRFRLGPFTFGRSGTRLSLWGGGTGISIPLSGKGRTFGKVGVGPVSWTGTLGDGRSTPATEKRTELPQPLTAEELAAIEALRGDQDFLRRLQRNGLPWRGVQERLKEEMPDHISARDDIAYALVPTAMNLAIGPQGTAWNTVKRPSKTGSGTTTWIVLVERRET